MARAIGNRRGEAAVLCSLALVHEASGRHEEALRHVELAVTAVPDLDDDHALVDHLQANLGLVHLRLRRRETAAKHLGEALAGARVHYGPGSPQKLCFTRPGGHLTSIHRCT